MDMQTDVRRSAGFAAIVQALVATAPAPARSRTTASSTRARRERGGAPSRPTRPRSRRSPRSSSRPLEGAVRDLAEAVLDGPPGGGAPARGRGRGGIAAVRGTSSSGR